jgi:hypothetical protein
MTDDERRFSIPETASISGSSRRCSTVRAPNPERFRQSMFQNLSLGIEGFLGRWRNHNVFREQIRRTKRTVIPRNTSSNAHRHAHFFRFFEREWGPKNKRPLLRFFEHPPCPRPRSVTEKRLQRFNWTRADALESIPVALQSRFSALRISST